MEKNKRLLKIGGIISICYGSLLFLSQVFLIFGIMNIVLGIILLVYQNKSDEELFSSLKNLMVIGILSFLSCLITAILVIIAHENISNYKKSNMNVKHKKEKPEVIKEVVSPEARKIDIILKVGIGLVILSGIIFSTSNWAVIPDTIKPIFMLLLSALFGSLSYFFKNKIIIKKSEITYDILSKIFIVCFTISIGYFESFGNYLSFYGDGYRIMYAIVLFTVSAVSYLIKLKYDKKMASYITYLSTLLGIGYILYHFEFETMQVLLTFSLISILMILYEKKKNNIILDDITHIVTIIITTIYILEYFSLSSVGIFDLFAGISIIGILLYRAYNDKRFIVPYKIGYPIVSSIIISNTVYLIFKDSFISYEIIIYILMMAFLYVFTKPLNKAESYSGVISSLVFIYVSLMSLFYDKYYLLTLFFSLILIGFMTYIMNKNTDNFLRKLSVFVQLAALCTFINSVVYYYNYTITTIDLSYNTTLQLFLCSFGLLTFLQRKVYDEFNFSKVFHSLIVCSLAFFGVVFMKDHSIIFNLIILSMLILFKFYSSKYVENKYDYVLNYILILSGYMHMFNVFAEYNITLIGNIVILMLLGVATYLFKDNKRLSPILLITMYAPLVLIIEEAVTNNNLYLILTRLPLMLMCFIFTRMLFISKNKTKFILEIVLLSLIFMSYVFNIELSIGLFTGLLALLMIMIGFKYEKYNSLFYVGIGVTVINIIVQLFEFWSKVPIFMYLLISGLILIGFVTYKEINKDKKKVEKIKKEIVDEPYIEEKGDIKNIISIVAILILIPCISYNYYQIKVSESNKFVIHFNNILSQENIDVNKIYFEEYYGWNETELYVLNGYKIDLDKFIKLYNKEGKHLTGIQVNNVSQNCLDMLRKDNDINYACYDEKYYNYYYESAPETNYLYNGFNINVMNENINHLEFYSYCSEDCSKVPLNITYNNLEEKSLNVCISNFDKEIYNIYIADERDNEIDSMYRKDNENSCFNIYGDGYVKIFIEEKEQEVQTDEIIDTNN